MARLKTTGLQFQIAQQRCLVETHRLLVATARREHAKVLEAPPRPLRFTRYVDGAQGAPEEAVRANGVITYVYNRVDVVVQFAMETLFDRSPVYTGAYRLAHTIFLNGVAVSNLKDWKPGSEVSIANFLPYSRKIEIGAMTMRQPGTDHVYEQAEQIVKRRYGNVATIIFTYRGIIGGGIVGGKPGNRSEVRYPALIILER